MTAAMHVTPAKAGVHAVLVTPAKAGVHAVLVTPAKAGVDTRSTEARLQ
jgi:hypothetical protein